MGAYVLFECGFASSGEDGPSQMALEDLAIFRNIPNCTIFYPSDAVSTEYAVFLAAITKVHLRALLAALALRLGSAGSGKALSLASASALCGGSNLSALTF